MLRVEEDSETERGGKRHEILYFYTKNIIQKHEKDVWDLFRALIVWSSVTHFDVFPLEKGRPTTSPLPEFW